MYAFGDWPESFLAGAFSVRGGAGQWSLALGSGGDLRMRPRFLEALCAGTRALAHASSGGKPAASFPWQENGDCAPPSSGRRPGPPAWPDASPAYGCAGNFSRTPPAGRARYPGRARRGRGKRHHRPDWLCPLWVAAFADGFQQQGAGKDIADVHGK
ncbi:DUF6461 domain-containing protein [Streptomyces sp. NPDC096311]|uniref:DUF6461 domain-containing protein n=1 Tax=Streptomyces sp. NPDC096311 TaxID=3366083 RepID=UPI003829187A